MTPWSYQGWPARGDPLVIDSKGSRLPGCMWVTHSNVEDPVPKPPGGADTPWGLMPQTPMGMLKAPLW